MTIKLHIKNNHAGPDTFPSTPESEPVFTISMDRYREVAARYPELAKRLEVFVDWDTDHWVESMRDAEVLLTAVIDQQGRRLIRISDNGHGIAAESLEKVFIPFYSTKRTGTGIGLSLSRQIMRRHGGDITVVSDPGAGATFTLRFAR